MIIEKEEEQVMQWIYETFTKLRCKRLMNQLSIEWNTKFKTRMGDALYYRNKAKIRLNKALWPYASEKEKYQTIVHETCHIVDDYFHKTKKGYRCDGIHGDSWYKLMKRMGVKLKRCHSVPIPSELRSPWRKVKVRCDCTEHKITLLRARKMMDGYVYYCRLCDSDLRLF